MTTIDNQPLGQDPDTISNLGMKSFEETSYFILRVADSFYAFLSESVEFVAPPEKPLRVPTAPGRLLGIVHARGRIVTVVDLAALLGLSPNDTADKGDGEEASDKRLVVLQSRNRPFAIIADEVIGLRSIRDDQIREMDRDADLSDESGALFEGRFEYDRVIVPVLRPEALLLQLSSGATRVTNPP